MRLSVALLFIVLVTSATAEAQQPPPAPPLPAFGAVYWERDQLDPHVVRGGLIVPATPAVVWARLERVDAWPAMFTDVSSLRVTNHDAIHWSLRVETRTFACGAHDYVVRVYPDHAIEIRIQARGVDGLARIVVREGPTPGTSIVSYSLTVEATGSFDWLANENELHQKQEQMVERYLNDLHTAFATPTAPPRTAHAHH